MLQNLINSTITSISKVAVALASKSLFEYSGGKFHLSHVNIQVPGSWTSSDCQTSMETNLSTSRDEGDIFIGPDHPIYGSEPWTQQSQSCGNPGDFIYVPRSFIKIQHNEGNETDSNVGKLGQELRNQFLRYRFGVFQDGRADRTPLSVNSRQHSLCYGQTVMEIIEKHPDFTSSRVQKKTMTAPPDTKFTIFKAQPPVYVLILENSMAMDHNDHWELIQKSAKKFILHDLADDARLGLVLFNSGAHVAHEIQELKSGKIRRGLAVMIKNKFSLSPKNDSCVMCGFTEAISALPSNVKGATFIVISQGKSSSLDLHEEMHLLDLSKKHRVKLFSISIPEQPQDDLSLSLERLAHSTGGQSFFIPEESYRKVETELSTYVHLVDAFSGIQSRISNDGPFLVGR